MSEQNVEPEVAADEGRQSRKPDLERENMATNQEKKPSSHNTDLLLDSIGNDNFQECLQPLPCVNLGLLKTTSHTEKKGQIPNEDIVVASILDTDKKISQSEDSVRQGSILDDDIEIGGLSETGDFLKQDSACGEDSPQKDGDYKELCIDSNLRLVTCSVHNQSELIMLLKLTNHNQSRAIVEGISLKIEPPSNLIADTSRTEFIVEKLSFLETVSILLLNAFG